MSGRHHTVVGPTAVHPQDTGGAAPSSDPEAELRGGCWDPNDDNRIAVAAGNGFQARQRVAIGSRGADTMNLRCVSQMLFASSTVIHTCHL